MKKWQEMTLKQKVTGIVGLLLVVFIIFIGISLAFGGKSDKKDAESKSAKDNKLQAKLSLEDSKITITNLDKFDWQNCEFELNYETFKGGYKHKFPSKVIKPNETYGVGIAEFTKGDGERFNTFTHKAERIAAYCQDTDGKLYSGFWDFK